ncbi:MAG TPA: response regulator [Clostridiaceae bacterium]|nr:response regulator [Clostridiaceae bacterium]
MYNILIVDDDISFRTYLRNFIDWEKEGCKICHEADNGQLALDYLKNNKVDIVFTDMSMPILNGVGLIEQAGLIDSNIVFIVLSGFDDFDYVKHSLKNGALDYILKHRLTEDGIIDILSKAKSRLQNIYNNNDSSELIKMYQKDISSEIVKRLILEGCKDKSEAIRILSNSSVNLDIHKIQLMVVEIDEYDSILNKIGNYKQLKRFTDTFVSICQSILDDIVSGMAIHMEGSRFVLIFSNNDTFSDSYILERNNQIINRVRNSVKRLLNITCCISVSNVCDDISLLDTYYTQAINKMSLRFYCGNNQVFFDEPRTKIKSGNNYMPFVNVSDIRPDFSNYAYDEIMKKINMIYDECFTNQVEPDVVEAISLELTSMAVAVARNKMIDISKLYIDGKIPHSYIKSQKTFVQLKEGIIQLYNKLFDELQAVRFSDEYSEVPRKAILYIAANYSNDISLDTVADHIGVNSSYLSRVFKKETGKGFIEYLNCYRI